MNSRIKGGSPSVGLGVVLVLLGGLFLLEQFFGVRLGNWLWPFFIIIPGLLFFVGMLLDGKSAGALAIPGSIVTMVGLLLLYQNIFNHFESWAYAWALIPVAAGIGMLIHGAWSDRPALMQHGRRTIGVGLVLFLFGFVFFELMLNIGGIAGGIFAPLLLIGLGFYLLLRRYSAPFQPAAAPAPTEVPAQPAAPMAGSVAALPPAAPTEVAPVLQTVRVADLDAPSADQSADEELMEHEGAMHG